MVIPTDPEEVYYGMDDTCLFCGQDVSMAGDSICEDCLPEYEEALDAD